MGGPGIDGAGIGGGGISGAGSGAGAGGVPGVTWAVQALPSHQRVPPGLAGSGSGYHPGAVMRAVSPQPWLLYVLVRVVLVVLRVVRGDGVALGP